MVSLYFRWFLVKRKGKVRKLIDGLQKKINKSRIQQLKLENLFLSNKTFLKNLYTHSKLRETPHSNKLEFSLDQNRKSRIIKDYIEDLTTFDSKIDNVIHNYQEKFLIDNLSIENTSEPQPSSTDQPVVQIPTNQEGSEQKNENIENRF